MVMNNLTLARRLQALQSNVFADIPAQKVAWGSPCRPQYDRKMNP